MDKNSTQSIRDLVENNTRYVVDDDTGVEGYFEPFIEDCKVGYRFRDHFGREETIYLEPCENESLVWMHLHDPDEESSPETFYTLAKDWPNEKENSQ